MKERTWTVLLGAAASWAAAVEGVAQQGYVLVVVGGVLDRSQTWSPVDATGRPQVYRLVGEVVVVNGATLTIEAGTLVVSEPAQRGGLAVTAGCQIHCLGTPEEPVLFTTTADAATWDVVGGLSDPATGAVREAAGEWGRLAVLGRAFVNTDARSGNVPFPDANNRAPMPGLVPRFPGDPSVLHGGGDDADDSGTLRYTSLRYGGQDAAGAAARPGLALGSVGRGTDVEGVDVFSTLGDGIAVSGGTVDLRRLSVWNPGDDGVELELGYRGTVEHVSVVLGNALDGPRGAGVSDRAFELGGARAPDWQPVTTTRIVHATAVGQPAGGAAQTSWADGARVQFLNSIFLDSSSEVVGGGNGYGVGNTLTFPQVFATPWNMVPPHPNDGPIPRGRFYVGQSSGFLSEFRECVFRGHTSLSAYATFNVLGQRAPALGNVVEPPRLPVRSIVRGAPVLRGGLVVRPVVALDPRPAGSATTTGTLPNDARFSRGAYRGAFRPGVTWLGGWSSPFRYGLLAVPNVTDLGFARRGRNGNANLALTGSTVRGQPAALEVSNVPSVASVLFLVSAARLSRPLSVGGVTLVPDPTLGESFLAPVGVRRLPFVVPALPPGTRVFAQAFLVERGRLVGTNAVLATIE